MPLVAVMTSGRPTVGSRRIIIVKYEKAPSCGVTAVSGMAYQDESNDRTRDRRIGILGCHLSFLWIEFTTELTAVGIRMRLLFPWIWLRISDHILLLSTRSCNAGQNTVLFFLNNSSRYCTRTILCGHQYLTDETIV
jgi:hypothetical protein